MSEIDLEPVGEELHRDRSREYGGASQRLVRFEEETQRASEEADAQAEEEDFSARHVWPKYGELGKKETPKRLKAACDRVYTQYVRDCDDRQRRGGAPIDCLTGLGFDPSSVVPEVSVETALPPIAEASAPNSSEAPLAVPRASRRAESPESTPPILGRRRLTRKYKEPVVEHVPTFAPRILAALRRAPRNALRFVDITAATGLGAPDIRKALLELADRGQVSIGEGFWKLEATG